jgi:hypothetical protein
MQPYRDNVRNTFQALAYIVKGLDSDGIDVYFTMSSLKGHDKHRGPLLTLFDGIPFHGGQSNMEYTLTRILEGNKKKRWSLSSLMEVAARGRASMF